MARHPTILTSATPTSTAPAAVTIGHVQLRDLVICPRERGIVNYLHRHCIVEHNVNRPNSTPQTIVDVRFTPNTIASLHISGTDQTLLAAGGQEAELHVSLHSPASNWQYEDNSRDRRHTRMVWRFEDDLQGSINNSVLLTSMSLTRSNQSSVEPRVAVSNNDCTVKFYDIPMRGKSGPEGLQPSGALRLDVPVNHSSISPDGRTLLSVGDSPKVYLHQVTGGARVTFTPITTLRLPVHETLPLNYAASSLAASFSTAFSANGSKFAVASQEGIVVVWDVRSSKPLKVFETNKSPTSGRGGNSGASGWLTDDPHDWTRGGSRAPGWGVRSVKFGPGGAGTNSGGEVMTFTEVRCLNSKISKMN
jgi:WD40 repeat protein